MDELGDIKPCREAEQEMEMIADDSHGDDLRSLTFRLRRKKPTEERSLRRPDLPIGPRP